MPKLQSFHSSYNSGPQAAEFVRAQAENGEAAAVNGSGGSCDGSSEAAAKKRGFTRSESFRAAFGPTMVSRRANAAKNHDCRKSSH